MKLITWIIVNGLILAALYAGITFHPGWINIVTAAMVINFLSLGILTLSVIALDSLKNKTNTFDGYESLMNIIKPLKPSVPRWVDVTYDLIVGSVFIFNGWWFVPCLLLVASFMSSFVYGKAEEFRK